ncbi:MAG: SDR family NAD(P)-dependent oxidoreductase [Promethearchaeota archaeon]
MQNNKFLEGKVAFITGSGSGFGREMALAFASKGANLVLNDINLKSIEETREMILKSYNVEIFLAQADISDFSQIKSMSKKVFDRFDNVFLLVNNAGINEGLYKSLSLSQELYEKVMNVNVKGAWNVTKAFYRKMKGQRNFKPIRGKIINIASCAGTECGINPYFGMYSVSKAALIALTKVWALELGSSNITVNAISPGLFLTPIYKDDPTLIRKTMEMRSVKLPIDRIGKSKEVADIALFLASPTSDYMTGQNIILDGGMTVSINKM